jgi:hypothetical protein
MQEYKELEIDVSDDTALSDVIQRIVSKVSLKRSDNLMRWLVKYPYRELAELKPKERLELIVYLMWFFKLSIDIGEEQKTEAKTNKTPSYAV